jgi:cytidyltransferase-like protein
MSPVLVTGPFDELGSRELRFLQEASRLGELTVLLWPDSAITRHLGKPPQFPMAEREYVLKAIRYVSRLECLSEVLDPNSLPRHLPGGVQCWVDTVFTANAKREEHALALGMQYRVLDETALHGFPEVPAVAPASGRKKVVVTGCFDWLHSGHVRFFEEVSSYGDLIVVVGHDANIRLLKGQRHPHFPDKERRYLVSSVRHVSQALVSTGTGWLDAAPEIERLRPDIYVVNEDGDRGGKREYCQKQGIEYVVLKRQPAPGLSPRTSTELRGF